MAGRYTGSYLDRSNDWRAVAILGWHRPSFTHHRRIPTTIHITGCGSNLITAVPGAIAGQGN
jgi:hypothetical protein